MGPRAASRSSWSGRRCWTSWPPPCRGLGQQRSAGVDRRRGRRRQDVGGPGRGGGQSGRGCSGDRATRYRPHGRSPCCTTSPTAAPPWSRRAGRFLRPLRGLLSRPRRARRADARRRRRRPLGRRRHARPAPLPRTPGAPPALGAGDLLVRRGPHRHLAALGDLATSDTCAPRSSRSPSTGVRRLAGHSTDGSRLHAITGNLFYVTEVPATEHVASVPLTVADAVHAGRPPRRPGDAAEVVAIEPPARRGEQAVACRSPASTRRSRPASSPSTATCCGSVTSQSTSRSATLNHRRLCRPARRRPPIPRGQGRRPGPPRPPRRARRRRRRKVPVGALAATQAMEAGAVARRWPSSSDPCGTSALARSPRPTSCATWPCRSDPRPPPGLAGDPPPRARGPTAIGDAAGAAMALAELGRTQWGLGFGDEAYRTMQQATDDVDALPPGRHTGVVYAARFFSDMLARRPAPSCGPSGRSPCCRPRRRSHGGAWPSTRWARPASASATTSA